MLRRAPQALPHGRRSLAADDHRRPRGRAARARTSRRRRRSSSRARGPPRRRSSFRSRRRRPSRSGVSAPTACTGRASSSRCPCGGRTSTRSTSSRIRDGIATLDLRVSSGTYVRSIADALGGHCVALRRTEVGPFSVEEADAERVLPLEDALGRIGLTLAEAEAERRRKSLPPTGPTRRQASDRRAGERRQPAWRRGDPGEAAGGSAGDEDRPLRRPSSSVSHGRSRSAPSTASTAATAASSRPRSTPASRRR